MARPCGSAMLQKTALGLEEVPANLRWYITKITNHQHKIAIYPGGDVKNANSISAQSVC